MSNKTESRKLICQLSEDELLQRGNELAKTYIEIAALDLQKKRITSQIKPLDERIEALVVIIDTKEEERSIACEWQPDFGLGIKRLVRLDTYETIDTRDIKDWERQQQFDLETSQPTQQAPAVCPKCEGDGHYIDDDPDKEEGGEVFCDCEAGIAAREKATSAAELPHDCQACRTESGCDQCCKSCGTKCHNEMICRVDEAREMGEISLCATCQGICGDYTPGTQVSECAGFCADPSEEMINHRDTICMDEWRECKFANACFGPANEDGPCDCLADKAKKARKSPYVEPEKDGVTASSNQPTLSELCANCHKASCCDDCCRECLSPCNTKQNCTWPGAEGPATVPDKRVTLEQARAKRAKLVKAPNGKGVKK